MNQGLGQERMSLWGCLMQTNLGTPSTAGGGGLFLFNAVFFGTSPTTQYPHSKQHGV